MDAALPNVVFVVSILDTCLNHQQTMRVPMQLDLVLVQMREAMHDVGAEVTVLRRSAPAHPTKSSPGAPGLPGNTQLAIFG